MQGRSLLAIGSEFLEKASYITLRFFFWEMFLECVSLFPQEKGKHIKKFDPHPFADNPEKFFMFIVFFSPDFSRFSARRVSRLLQMAGRDASPGDKCVSWLWRLRCSCWWQMLGSLSLFSREILMTLSTAIYDSMQHSCDNWFFVKHGTLQMPVLSTRARCAMQSELGGWGGSQGQFAMLGRWEKIDRKFATKKPLHVSISKIQNFITKNFWDQFLRCAILSLLLLIKTGFGGGFGPPKLPRITRNCLKLPDIAWNHLTTAQENCLKLPGNCRKLPEKGPTHYIKKAGRLHTQRFAWKKMRQALSVGPAASSEYVARRAAEFNAPDGIDLHECSSCFQLYWFSPDLESASGVWRLNPPWSSFHW